MNTHRRLKILLLATFFLSNSIGGFASAADNPVPQLVISQFKITSNNGQFFTLYNNTNQTLDMTKFQLEYFNNYDVAKASSSKLIALTGQLPAHSYFMVSDSSQMICYQMTIDSTSLGFSSTAGMLEVLAFNQSSSGSAVLPTIQDYVSWSKNAVSGSQTLSTNINAFFQRQPIDSLYNPLVLNSGAGSWQLVQHDVMNPCKLTTLSNLPVHSASNDLLPSAQPPATFVTLASAVNDASTIPASDIGLMTPIVTELLPNPNGVGTDDTDEFIEVYNPNSTAFDLSGFSLEAGITSTHLFPFAGGTSLSPHSFTAFFASDTNISLSNRGGQVRLLNPTGDIISSSEAYGPAPDGQTWALANGVWYWTLSPTPNQANVINQPIDSKPKTGVKVTKSSRSSKHQVLGSSARTKSVPTKKTKSSTSKTTTKVAKLPAKTAANKTPIHPWVLALVVSCGLLYGIYEYRSDIANRIYQFRKYLTTRRKFGS